MGHGNPGAPDLAPKGTIQGRQSTRQLSRVTALVLTLLLRTETAPQCFCELPVSDPEVVQHRLPHGGTGAIDVEPSERVPYFQDER